MFGPQRRNGDTSREFHEGLTCGRCHSTRRLVTDDGPVVCWPCLVAWGSFAGLVTAGPTAIEPVMVSMCRTGHHRPRPGCAWCLGRLGERSPLGTPDPNGQRGPAA